MDAYINLVRFVGASEASRPTGRLIEHIQSYAKSDALERLG